MRRLDYEQRDEMDKGRFLYSFLTEFGMLKGVSLKYVAVVPL